MTKFSFTATTKSGITLELFYSSDNGKINIGARNTKTGYQHTNVGYFDKVQGFNVIRLTNVHINQQLIGAKITGVVKITNYNEAEYKAAVEDCKQLQKATLQKEIESLEKDDTITISMCITGYGAVYTLKNKKLSYEASKTFSKDIRTLADKKLVKLSSIDFDSSFYETKMSYGEFCDLVEQSEKEDEEMFENEQKEIELKFEEAATSGKAVAIKSIFLSGDDIPKQFRDEDSDFGHLVTYAMPDGTTQESFVHAY